MKIKLKYSPALEQLAFLLSGEPQSSVENFLHDLEKAWSRVSDKTEAFIKHLTGVELKEETVYVTTSLPCRASLEPMVIKVCETLPEALDSLIYVLVVTALRRSEELMDKISLLSVASGFSSLIFEKSISMYVRFKIIEELYGLAEVDRIKRKLMKLSRSDRLSIELYDLVKKRMKEDSPEEFLKVMVEVVVEGIFKY